jgi:ATP-dependent helicase Lhr and Lhr-like helicase
MHEALLRLKHAKLLIHNLQRPGPLAFPLVVDQLRDRVSSEKLSDRVRRMAETLEKAAKSTVPERLHGT